MTETEWLACEDPLKMLAFLEREAITLVDVGSPELREARRRYLLGINTGRKRGLFACACCRRLWPLLQDERSRKAVEATEGSLDGRADDTQRWAAMHEAIKARDAIKTRPEDPDRTAAQGLRAAATAAMKTAYLYFEEAAEEAAVAATWAGFCLTLADAVKEQAAVLHDILGNPFQPPTVAASWQTPSVVGLASVIYEEKAFDLLPVLGDALQEAGCDNEEVLNHCCRQGLLHARGCWLIDLLLNKA